MKLIPLIFALLIVFCQIAPAIAVNSKEVTVEKTTKLKVKEASKEKVTVKEFISTASGDSKVKSKDIELKTEKLDKCLKISSTSKTKSKLVDSHDILVPVADIQNFNGHSVRITHFDDNGIQDYQYIQEVQVLDGYIVLPDVEFSSIIVDGFTGTYTKTIVGADITDFSTSFEGNYNSVHVSIPDAIDGVQMDENNSADYPATDKLELAMPMWNNINIINNVSGFDIGTLLYSNSNVYVSDNGYVQHPTIIFGANDSYSIVYRLTWNTSATIPDFVIYGGNDAETDNALYLKSGSTYSIFVRPDGETAYLLSGSDTSSIFDGNEHLVRVDVYQNHTVVCYIDNVLSGSTVLSANSIKFNSVGRGYTNNNYNFAGWINDYAIYNNTSIQSDRNQYFTFINGTAARTLPNATWVPVINGEADLPVDPSGNVTAIEVITSTGTATSDVSITGSWTENVTIIEESEDENHVYVYANITTSQNSTSGSWEYDVASLNFTYNMSINSDNSNVTGTYHNGTVTLDTGLLNFGDSFNYTLTFDKLTSFTFWANWISKTSTKAVVEYNSTNSNVENDFYLENMSASSTFDFKYSNGTILVNATSDSNGYLKFDDVGGVTDSYKLINDTYTIEKQAEKFPVSTFIISSFVAVVAGFFGLRFGNQRRKR